MPVPLVTRGGDVGPVGEGVQLAQTRLVNIPHLNTPTGPKHLLFLITPAAKRQLGVFTYYVIEPGKLSRLKWCKVLMWCVKVMLS